MNDLIRYFVEFIGTFIFIAVILMTGQAIPIGIALAAVIYFGGTISGGAFNPAVAFAYFIRQNINAIQLVGYIIAQLLGALAAYHYFKYVSMIKQS